MSKTNKVVLIGSIGKDPETKEFENGNKATTFSIATKDGYKGKDGKWVDTVDWHNCVAYSYNANAIAAHVKKGSSVIVWGKLKNSPHPLPKAMTTTHRILW